ncbi:hypothetical protein [Streptomyces sp. AK08-01B]|uniref:hypothetical protein n=1 Tax=unclassified Streptomyces TaxID=2593676 RepID=UPI0039F58EEB
MTAGVRASVPGPAPQGRSGSGPDEDFRASRAGHDPVSVGHLVEADGAVEDPARLDPPVEYVRQEPVDVGAGRSRAAEPGPSYAPAGLRWSPSRPVPTAARAALPGAHRGLRLMMGVRPRTRS